MHNICHDDDDDDDDYDYDGGGGGGKYNDVHDMRF
jgi:hypothetical protein